jgi:hypothetical protein
MIVSVHGIIIRLTVVSSRNELSISIVWKGLQKLSRVSSAHTDFLNRDTYPGFMTADKDISTPSTGIWDIGSFYVAL